ncbi:MAG TPA: RidA family protein [Chloroflexota bacterium]|nr:RidA family protein [Chloroflexota bacterium]
MLTEIFGNPDIDPIPLGIRVGNLVHASRLTGVNLETGELAEGVEAQVGQVLEAVKQVVETAGGTIDNVAQVSFFLKRFDDRPLINTPWVAMFPNDQDRPTYKFMAADLPGAYLVQAEMWAVLDARRQVLYTPPVAHTNPIPMGVKIGGYVFSSRILPFEPATNAPGDGLERQAQLVFENLQAFLEAAGIGREDLDQARIFVSDRAHIPTIQQHWDAFFHEAAQRPVVRTVIYPQTPAAMVYIEVIAHERAA